MQSGKCSEPYSDWGEYIAAERTVRTNNNLNSLIPFIYLLSNMPAMDISADLQELTRCPVGLVSSGVKSILDIGRFMTSSYFFLTVPYLFSTAELSSIL